MMYYLIIWFNTDWQLYVHFLMLTYEKKQINIIYVNLKNIIMTNMLSTI